ncbi:type IX secretion system ring subunit PorN/GldN [Mucilaginibacter psychrotolerans]|uniref:Gliding motility protein GldN n=1 Tax=Mucilaginibacter psychrotolerans TaxID=1524096 RepID=A0A4Y8SP55_9SPHI|nr:gliding motility protein GldN [Mucilaginibacter psychrotolerans]TFF40176.1 gliding motility protein GldN [Mucilaginibacter psychrotolerans]
MMRLLFLFAMLFIAGIIRAQIKPPTLTAPMADTAVIRKGVTQPQDGYYKKAVTFKPTELKPLPNVREADVLYAKRVWREIDTREKMNRYMNSPKQRLIDILMKAIDAGTLTAYDAQSAPNNINGDGFANPLSPIQARRKMADSTVVDIIDNKTGDKTGSKVVAGEFNPDSVVKFRVKEDWVFEKQRAVYVLRIIGIAPMVKVNVAGINTTYQPAFWINFEQAKKLLANTEVFDANNNATGLSYADVFFKRLFTSYIIKQSNDKDERIRNYAQGIDNIYESDRIKKRLMDWEIDVWVY